MIEPDCEGKITCPICRKRYTPKLKRRDNRLIQEQYPDATPAEREELISGICQKCQPTIFRGAPPPLHKDCILINLLSIMVRSAHEFKMLRNVLSREGLRPLYPQFALLTE